MQRDIVVYILLEIFDKILCRVNYIVKYFLEKLMN